MKEIVVLSDADFEKRPVSKASLTRRKMIAGVGINDVEYLTSYNDGSTKYRCGVYDRWKTMLTRCYGGKNKYYLDCTVNSEWHSFSNFRKWLLERTDDLTGLSLDKDLKVFGNREYGPDTCILIKDSTNTLISGSYKTGLIGANWSERDKLFYVSLDNRYIGSSKCEVEAHKLWYAEKRKQIDRHCGNLEDTLVVELLKKRYPEESPYLTR
jgi:hypothetical protein